MEKHRSSRRAANLPFIARRVRTGAVCLLLCSVVPLFGAQAKDQGAQPQSVDEWTAEHFQRAHRAQAEKNFAEAAEEYRAILARHPGMIGAQLNLGIVYHQQRQYRDAIKALEGAVSAEPNLLGGQVFLGIDEYLVGDLKGALRHLQKALELKPQDRQAGIFLGLTYLDLDEPEKAAQQLRKTERYSPGDADIYFQEGRAYLSGMKEGLTVLRQANPDSAVYHWALALAAEQKNDFVSAMEENLKALARDPGIAELYLRLAEGFAKIRMPALAAACLERYKVLNPLRDVTALHLEQAADDAFASQPEIIQNKEVFQHMWEAMPAGREPADLPAVADESVNIALKTQMSAADSGGLKEAVLLYLKGDYRQAMAKLEPRVDHHMDKWFSAYLLARCSLSNSDDDAAQATLEAHLEPYFNLPPVALLRVETESRLALRSFNWVIAHQPDSFLAQLLLAESYAAARQDKEAIAAYQEALKLSPQRLGIHLAIGQVYENQMQYDSAISEYQAELALDSENAMALAHLGHVYTEARDPDRAIPVLERLLQSNPTDGQGLEDLGKALALKGDTANAIAAYERALQYVPDEYDIHYRLFGLYTKTGDTARAQTHLAAFKSGEAKKKQSYQNSMAELVQENKAAPEKAKAEGSKQ